MIPVVPISPFEQRRAARRRGAARAVRPPSRPYDWTDEADPADPPPLLPEFDLRVTDPGARLLLSALRALGVTPADELAADIARQMRSVTPPPSHED